MVFGVDVRTGSADAAIEPTECFFFSEFSSMPLSLPGHAQIRIF